jgi:hypothetical protein
MALDLNKLEALAMEAAPGPWRESMEAVWQGTPESYGKFIICDTGDAPKGTLEYIAAVDPQTVMELIAEVRACRQRTKH